MQRPVLHILCRTFDKWPKPSNYTCLRCRFVCNNLLYRYCCGSSRNRGKVLISARWWVVKKKKKNKKTPTEKPPRLSYSTCYYNSYSNLMIRTWSAKRGRRGRTDRRVSREKESSRDLMNIQPSPGPCRVSIPNFRLRTAAICVSLFLRS